MEKQFKIYAGGESGWVENKIGNSIHFVVYQLSTKPSKVTLGWDSEPTKGMSILAKRMVAKYQRLGMTGDFKNFEETITEIISYFSKCENK